MVSAPLRVAVLASGRGEDRSGAHAPTVFVYPDRPPTKVAIEAPAVSVLARILERGRASGDFTRDVTAIDVHMLISAYCFFRMSNRHTFGAIFGIDLLDQDHRGRYRTMVGDMIVSYLTAPA